MSVNLLKALPEWGGFNRLEKEEYYRLFINGQEDTVELLSLASQIAKDNGWELEDTVSKLQNAKANQIEAIAALGKDGLSKLVAFTEKQKRAKLMQGFDLARLILLSRLPVEWLAHNQKELENYGITFDIATIQDIPRQQWLIDERRRFVINQIVELLPSPMLSPVEAYAIRELNEGKEPDNVSEDREPDPLD